MAFHSLVISEKMQQTDDAVSLSFELPEQLYEEFNYYPGQHLVFKFLIDGQEVRRTYSLNSCPYTNEALQVTVKRVKDGLVSNHIIDKVRVGDKVEVMAPQGRFYCDVDEKDYKTYFLFAAGSGITPIISILKSVLVTSPYSVVNLLYGNTDRHTIIFKKELDDVQEQYADRLQIVHTLSKLNVWASWEQWKGRKGRIDSDAVKWFIANHPPRAQSTEYYICGPGAMNISTRKTLMALGIPKHLIHIEQFGGDLPPSDTHIDQVGIAQLSVTIKGQNHGLEVQKGDSLLDALKKANISPPYSCESGVCGSCVAKVVQGRAEMKACMALEQEEIDEGLVLTCQALPVTDEIEIKFE